MSEPHANVEERAPNWLPLPFEVETKARRKASGHVEADLFRKGDIDVFYPFKGEGLIKNERGEQFPFNLKEIAVIGDAKNIEEGMKVGYDISRTSHGPKVTCLKIY